MSKSAMEVAVVGDRATVTLPESPTTGTRWRVVLLTAGVVLEADVFVRRGSPAGERILRFRVGPSRRYAVRLALGPSWEPASAKTLELTLVRPQL